jgi:lambda repressor-like predicted transcriptional regulator
VNTRDASIRARFNAGESLGALAVEFGVSRQRIWQIVAKFGPPRVSLGKIRKAARLATPLAEIPRVAGPNIAAVIALREAGLSYGAIAKERGSSMNSVYYALSKWRPYLLGYLPANKQFKRAE